MKNITLTLLSAITICACLTAAAQPYQVEKHNGKYGIRKTETGEWKLAPAYDLLVLINDSLVINGTGGKPQTFTWSETYTRTLWGANEEYLGDTIDTINHTDTCMAGMRCGVIDVNGKTIVPQNYSFIYYDWATNQMHAFTNDHYMLGKSLTNRWYNAYIGSVEMNYLTYAYVNYIKAYEVENSPFDIYSFNRCMAQAVDSVGNIYLGMDENGNVFTPFYRKGMMGIFDHTGKQLCGFTLKNVERAFSFRGNRMIVLKENGKYQFVNEYGKKYLSKPVDGYYTYGEVFFTYNGTHVVADTITEMGNPDYNEIYMNSKTNYIFTGGVMTLYDENVKPYATFDSVSFGMGNGPEITGFMDGSYSTNILNVYNHKKAGWVDVYNGKVLVKPMYDEIKILAEYGYHDYNSSRKILVGSGKKYGIVEYAKDSVFLPAIYDTIIQIARGYYKMQIAGQFQLIREDGIRTKQKFDSIVVWDRYSYPRYSAYFTVYAKNHAWLMDDSLRTIMDSVARWEKGCYTDGRTTWMITTTNGLTGTFDLQKKTWITKPGFNAWYQKPNEPLLTIVRVYGTDSLKGLLHCDGTIMFTPSARELVFNPEFNLYQAKLDADKRIYINGNGELLPDQSERLKLSTLPELQKAALPSTVEATWTSLNGPVGADATAFYIDKKGGYWLGTGSSGGVYFSSDKGKTWSPRINGTGPVHVLDIRNFSDSILMVASVPGDLRFMYDNNKYRDYNKMFYWKQKDQRWIELDTTRINKYHEKFSALWLEEIYTQDTKYAIQQGGTTIKDYYYYYGYATELKLKVKDVLGADSLTVDNIPVDITQPRKLIHTLDKQHLLLLTQSGAYKINPSKNTVARLGEAGLMASDVTRIIPAGNVLYAVVGQNSIWKMEEGKWTRMIHTYDLVTPEYAPRSINEHSVSISPAGKIFFSTEKTNYLLDLRGKLHPFNHKHRINNAYFTADDKLMVMISLDGSNYNYENVLAEYTLRDSSVVPKASVNGAGSYLLHVSDTTWMYESSGTIEVFGKEFKLKNMLDAGYMDMNTIGTGANGSIITGNYEKNALRVWNERAGTWAYVAVDSMHTLAAVTMLADGKIIYATNYKYESGGCGSLDLFKALPQLYYLHYNGKTFQSIPIHNPVNPRILSLQAHPTKPASIYVGTSGSGLYELKLDFK